MQYDVQWKQILSREPTDIKKGNKVRNYNIFKYEYKIENYILELPYKYISPLASLRIRSHSLKIETGRYEIKTGSRRWVPPMERYGQNCRTRLYYRMS